MNNMLTLPALGASILVAVAGGVQLGESTVGMINPIHFQGPAVHPRDRGAAIEEAQIRPAQASFGSLYGWDQGRSAMLQDCGDCEALAARDAYAEFHEPEVRVHRATIEEWEQPAASDEHQGMGGPDEIEIRDLDAELRARVARYAYYEIQEPEVAEEAEAELYVEE